MRIRPGFVWVLAAMSWLIVAAGAVLVWANRVQPDAFISIFEAVGGVTLPFVGAIIVSRRPNNVIGWLVGAGGFVSVSFLVREYVIFADRVGPHSLPAVGAAHYVGGWIGQPPSLAFVLLLLLYPTGHLLSRRWRWVAWIAAAGTLAITAANMGLGVFLYLVAGPLNVVAAVLGVVALFLRFRRARGVERQQVKWVAFAGVLSVATGLFVAIGNGLVDRIAESAPYVIVPAAIGMAIVRYRLFDIDRIISRTLAYAVVTTLLGGTFALLVLVPTTLLGSGTKTPGWLVALATLIVFGLFRPVLRRVRSVVDRRFNRSRYDAAQTIEAFTARLRDEVDLATLRAELEDVTRTTMQPAHVHLWVRGGTA